MARGPKNLGRLLSVPGELVRPHGILTLKLPQSFPHQQAFWTTLKSVNRFRV